MRRLALLLSVCTACTSATEPFEEPEPPALERVWGEAIRPGDMIVVVPGTGAFTGLGALIEGQMDPARPAEQTVFDGREFMINVDPVEGAVAAARRAGVAPADLTFALWGAGITKLETFQYRSVDGELVTFEVIGGHSECGDGGIPENIVNYNEGNAERDARDMYERIQTTLAGGSSDRNVTLVAHSWGGVVAEYFAANLATFVHDYGPLDGNVAFAAAAGVPGFVPGFATFGNGFRTVESRYDDLVFGVRTYEVDRPDDPVNSFDPNANGGGHHYIVMFGDDYRGFYGFTTDELSCGATPGECKPRS